MSELIAGGSALFTMFIIAFCMLATIVPIMLVLKRLGHASAANARLLTQGTAASARIMRVGQTGLTVNDAPQLSLVLEVQPPTAAGYRGGHTTPFTASAQILVPLYAMARLVPGATIPVRFDPMAPTNVAVDFHAMGYA